MGSTEHSLDVAALCYLVDHRTACSLTQDQINEISRAINRKTRTLSEWGMLKDLEPYLIEKYTGNKK